MSSGRSGCRFPASPIAGWIDGVAPKHEAVVTHRRPAQAAFALLQGCLARGRIVGRHGKHSGELKVSPAALRTMSAPLESTRNTGQISIVVGARRGVGECGLTRRT